MERQITSGVMAERSKEPMHKILYVLRKLGIKPISQAGAIHIYDAASLDAVLQELQRIKGDRDARRLAVA